MCFKTRIDTIDELHRELLALAIRMGGTAQECGEQAKHNFERLMDAPALQGRCRWQARIVHAVIWRADPNPDARTTPFPHRCGHFALLVEADDGTTQSCFILDDTTLQWDLPAAASHQFPQVAKTCWQEYFARYHSKSKAMIPMVITPASGTSLQMPLQAPPILVKASHCDLALKQWRIEIVHGHSFAMGMTEVRILSEAESRLMIP